MHAEPDVFVFPRPVGAKPAIPRRPRLCVVRRLEEPDALDDRPEPVGVFAVEHERRDPEMAWRLVRRVVPLLASGLSGECREQRPRLPVVATLEDPGRFDADEQAAVAHRKRRDFGDLSAALGVVRDPFARVRPRLAEIRTTPDGLTVPFACGRGVDRAARRVVDHVVHRPAFAERAVELPCLPVVACEEKGAFARSDQQQRS